MTEGHHTPPYRERLRRSLLCLLDRSNRFALKSAATRTNSPIDTSNTPATDFNSAFSFVESIIVNRLRGMFRRETTNSRPEVGGYL